jgi:hypothetical protein
MRILLSILAIAIGSAYFLSTFYLVLSVPELTGISVAIGWYGTAIGLLALGSILVGIGLGVVSIRFGKQNEPLPNRRSARPH